MTVGELIDLLMEAAREGRAMNEIRVVVHGHEHSSVNYPASDARVGPNRDFLLIAEERPSASSETEKT